MSAEAGTSLGTDENESNDASDRIARLEGMLEVLVHKEAPSQAPAKPDPWWTKAVAFLALPAAILAIYLQIQASGANQDTHVKTAAETQLAVTEELKTRADLQTQLDSIAHQQAANKPAAQAAANAALPRAIATSAQLNLLTNQVQQQKVDLLLKIAVVAIAITASNLFFDFLTQAWGTIVSGIFWLISQFRERQSIQPGRLRTKSLMKRVQDALPIIAITLSPLPSWLRWAVNVSIFFALSAPLFDQASAAFGSNVRMSSVIRSAEGLGVGTAIAKVRSVVLEHQSGKP